MANMLEPHIAFLRAVNVGGSGKLAMSDFAKVCSDAGLLKVKTYIASGNACYLSANDTANDKARIEAGLQQIMEKSCECLVLSLTELEALIANSPFRSYPGNQHVAILLKHTITNNDLSAIKAHSNELIHVGERCIYVYYPDGIGKSKLQIPAAQHGTARNFNTLEKMCSLANDLIEA